MITENTWPKDVVGQLNWFCIVVGFGFVMKAELVIASLGQNALRSSSCSNSVL